MKCPNCTQEVKAQRFCIYCGYRLQAVDAPVTVLKADRHVSAVMRLRQRRDVSQTRLPIPKSDELAQPMRLESLETLTRKGSQNAAQGHDEEQGEWSMTKQREDKRQSKELEALLLKLNGGLSMPDSEEVDSDSDSLELNMDVASMQMGRDASLGASLEEDFFMDNSEAFDVDMPSESIPMGSGAFSRTPSGGFRLLWESIREGASDLVQRIKGMVPVTAKSRNRNEQRDLRPWAIGAILLCSTVLLIVAIVAFSNDDTQENAQTVLAVAQAPETAQPQAQSAEFELIRIEDAPLIGMENAGVSETFDFSDDVEAESIEISPQPLKSVNQEKRLFGKNDNVLLAGNSAESVKLKRNCVMREGPASRFKLIRELKAKTEIQVLTNTQEDWLLQDVGGNMVWTKSCAGCTAKLGPGTQFADALAGQKVPPTTKGRVISSANWRYVQAGKEFGYIGPACFK